MVEWFEICLISKINSSFQIDHKPKKYLSNSLVLKNFFQVLASLLYFSDENFNTTQWICCLKTKRVSSTWFDHTSNDSSNSLNLVINGNWYGTLIRILTKIDPTLSTSEMYSIKKPRTILSANLEDLIKIYQFHLIRSIKVLELAETDLSNIHFDIFGELYDTQLILPIVLQTWEW